MHNERTMNAKGNTMMNEVQEAVKRITSQPHSGNLTLDQMEQRGRDQFFNQSNLRKVFKSHVEAGQAIRDEYAKSVK